MKTTLIACANSDDALLLWTADVLDDRLEGFSIQRTLRRAGKPDETTWIDNYAPPGVKSYQDGRHYPSDERPFRAFSWTDHSVGRGDRVRYRAVPFLSGTTAPSMSLASRWSRFVTVGSSTRAKYQAFFNRGFVISQFISRYLDETYPNLDRVAALKQFKTDITAQLDSKIRVFLSGDLRTALLDLLDEVKNGKGEIYAALFELGDDELIQRLVALKKRAHVVLSNGSIQIKTDPKTKKALETPAQARKRDENKDARKKLIDAGVDVQPDNRFVSPGALAHNKFLVVTDKDGKPRKAWTGSTNWTTTGLCTQLNNALLVDDANVAAAYLDQWHLLRDAGSDHPKALQTSNGTPTDVGVDKAGSVRSSVHFTRAPGKVDLTELGAIVRSAKEGVLFLMFMPGASGVLADVQALAKAKPKLLVRGVVSTLPNGRADETTGSTTTLKVTVVGGGPSVDGTQTIDVIQPEGMAHPTAWWAAETTRSQFLQGIGYAIVHSKVLVVDPFGDDPIVVTGSHNFSNSASQQNDENFIVVRGEQALAEAYAVNLESAWRHYAYRAGNPFPDLTGIDYLRALVVDNRREEPFWHLSA